MGSGVLMRISLAAFQRAAASISVQVFSWPEGGGGAKISGRADRQYAREKFL
jgi:hypothetical protein